MSPSVGKSWRAARDQLRAAGVPGADLDARVLAMAALGLDSLGLATREHEAVTDAGGVAFASLIARRLAGEPVARIIGEKEFYGLAFALNEATLVPRPETELLVDIALRALAGRGAARLLDLGTGTGCIPIAVLVNAPEVSAVAVDLSPLALEGARINGGRHGVLERLELVAGSWFDGLHGAKRFDVIVSNPPYIETDVLDSLSREVREHDPMLALDGGPDGLALYRVIADEWHRYLLPGGLVAVEIGSGQGAAVASLFAASGLVDVAVRTDLAGLDRVVTASNGAR